MKFLGLGENATYSSIQRVKEELMYANELFGQLDAHVTTVENKSIEEIAEHVIQEYKKFTLNDEE